MSMSSNLGRACLAISLLGAALLCGPASAQSFQEDEAHQLLASLRALRDVGELPSLTGFSPALPVANVVAPGGDHGHTQAFRDSNGCVAFFYPPSDDISGVAFKWSGAKCTGKLLDGPGELQVLRRVRLKSGAFNTAVNVYRGNFGKGMLTGEGDKGNYAFDASGKLVQDTYLFHGTFANSVLDGRGTKRWIGAPTDEPSAYSVKALFKEGTPDGPVLQGRLDPAPGVEADFTPLFYSPRGNPYVEQAHFNHDEMVQGSLFFHGDPTPWTMETYNWLGIIQAGALSSDHAGAKLHASCAKWDFTKDRVVCPEGTAGGGWRGQFFALDHKAFAIPVPYTASSTSVDGPLRVSDGELVVVGLEALDRPPIACSANLARCSGKLITSVLATPLYWHADATVREGTIYIDSGKLYERKNGVSYSTEYEYESDRLAASCSRMKSPLVCADGTVWFKNGGKVTGAWKFSGVDFEQVDEGGRLGYVAKRTVKMLPVGKVRFTYKEGSWAVVTMDDDGDLVNVDECDDPSDSARYACHMEGETMMFSKIR